MDLATPPSEENEEVALWRSLFRIESDKVKKRDQQLKEAQASVAEQRRSADDDKSKKRDQQLKERDRQLKEAQDIMAEQKRSMCETSKKHKQQLKAARDIIAEQKRELDDAQRVLRLAKYQQRKIERLGQIIERLRPDGPETKEVVLEFYDEELEALGESIHTTSADLPGGATNARRGRSQKKSVPDNRSATAEEREPSVQSSDAGLDVTPGDFQAAIQSSQEDGLLSMLQVRTGPGDAELLASATLPSTVLADIVELESRMGPPGVKKSVAGSKGRCLWQHVYEAGKSYWTRRSSMLYACRSCTNKRRPCIRRNQDSEQWELLPLVEAVRDHGPTSTERGYYIAAELDAGLKVRNSTEVWELTVHNRKRKRTDRQVVQPGTV